MLHTHVFLVTPLGTGHMPQSGADQHQGRIAVVEGANYSRSPADLPVQAFNNEKSGYYDIFYMNGYRRGGSAAALTLYT